MAILLLLLLICTALLAFTGSLPLWLSGLIAAATLAGLILQTRYQQLQQQKMLRRRKALRAYWGIPVRHLGGLPLPLETTGILFLTAAQLQLECDRSQLIIPLQDTRQILLTTADQIRKIPDRQLCSLLASISCRTFSALRGKNPASGQRPAPERHPDDRLPAVRCRSQPADPVNRPKTLPAGYAAPSPVIDRPGANPAAAWSEGLACGIIAKINVRFQHEF